MTTISNISCFRFCWKNEKLDWPKCARTHTHCYDYVAKFLEILVDIYLRHSCCALLISFGNRLTNALLKGREEGLYFQQCFSDVSNLTKTSGKLRAFVE